MYRNLCLVAFCLLASVSRIHCVTPPAAIFIKNNTSYESVFGNYAVDAPAPAGYVEIISEILLKTHQGSANFQELNKFGLALDQLFSFKFLQKYYKDKLDGKNVQTSDSNGSPISVPDFSDDSGVTFKELVVYNFPVFKKGAKPDFVHNSLSSAVEYQATSSYNADNTILTGSFYLGESKHFFVYVFKSSKYYLDLRVNRITADFIYYKRSFSFDGEDYMHTYDSSYDNSTSINAVVKEILTNKVVPYVLSELNQRGNDIFKYSILEKELKFSQSYEKLIQASFVKSALEYVQGYVQANNGNDTFTASDIVYNVDSPTAPLPFQQKVTNIQLKGFLNYENKPELVYSNTSISSNGQIYNMSQGVQFNYAQDGEKQAIASYIITSGRRDYPKVVKLKSITIISEYLGELGKRPINVYRNKEVFFNNAGILVRFETYDGDPVYDYVIKHIGNDIARSFQKLIENSLQ